MATSGQMVLICKPYILLIIYESLCMAIEVKPKPIESKWNSNAIEILDKIYDYMMMMVAKVGIIL